MKTFLIPFVCVVAISVHLSYQLEDNKLFEKKDLTASKSSGRKPGRNVTLTTTTTTTSTWYFEDVDYQLKGYRERGCSGKWEKLKDMITAKDISWVKFSWEMLKNNGNFAPKIFLRYFKAVPASQNLFPYFSNVTLSDLPTNSAFLLHVYTSIHSLNSIWYHYDLSSICPENCPVMLHLQKSHPSNFDFKNLTIVWMTALQEELGPNLFTPEVKSAWENALNVTATWFNWDY